MGKASWLVWTISIVFDLIQSFTYAEIAGLFPESQAVRLVYGAVAWVRRQQVPGTGVGVV
ncbi:MAG: hypothetical protein U1F34_07245 [Gammaproteobacteria bacterium]